MAITQTQRNKRKGLTKAPQEKTSFDDLAIQDCDPMDILHCNLEVTYRDGMIETSIVLCKGGKIAQRLRRKLNKKTDPISVVIKGYRVVGRKNVL